MTEQRENRLESTNPFILVDGSSYLFRAFHAMPPLMNSTGQPTGAIRGVVNMLKKLIKTYNPSHMAVVFDAKGPTFRNTVYSEYKANRPPMPDDLRSQIEPLHELVKALGLPLVMVEGVEADDVIGTLAKAAEQAGTETLISTGDKDMAQLVSEHITLFNSMNDTYLDSEGVKEKFGMPPELIIDYLALMGDKSDNIPGAPGVGTKSAQALIQGIGGIDALFKQLDDIAALDFRGAKSMAKKLTEHKEQVELSYQLATIKLDVDLEVDYHGLVLGSPDNEKLKALYQQLEFKADYQALLTADEGLQDEEKEALPTIEYETILTSEDLNRWINILDSASLVAIDTETTSLDYMDAELVGFSFAVMNAADQQEMAAYLPLQHDYIDAPEQLDQSMVFEKLNNFFVSERIQKVGQNLKYDLAVLAKYDITVKGIAFDTMLESYVLESTGSRHDLDSLAEKYLNHKNISFEEVAGKGKDQLTFNQVEIEKATEYAAEDALITLRLHHCLMKQLNEIDSLKALLAELEMPLMPVLGHIERNGTLIDPDLLTAQSQELADKMYALEQQTYELAGEEFNLGSTKQLGEILFQKLNIPVIKKTPKGAPSTAEPVLQELSHDYPLPKLILDYRSCSKLKSTYTDKLPKIIKPQTGRVHTSYHQAVTATGRLSSSDPNLQNIPVRTEEGRRIRKAFIAPPESKIVAADYSQIELRIMAHLSKDEGLLEAFRNGQDIHSATASEVFGVSLAAVSSDHRRSAKAINFGLIYGMSAFGLARQLGISRHDAQGYIDLYFDRYPGVKSYMDRIREEAHQQGYVETLYGRRLKLPEINSRNKQRQQAAERTAINAPMQGTAADIIKRAMISVFNWFQQDNLSTLMVMQVHDELVFEVPDHELETVVSGVRRLMEGAGELLIPLEVDVGIGANWEEAH